MINKNDINYFAISLFPKQKYVAKTTQKNIFTIFFLHSFLFIENDDEISEDYLIYIHLS